MSFFHLITCKYCFDIESLQNISTNQQPNIACDSTKLFVPELLAVESLSFISNISEDSAIYQARNMHDVSMENGINTQNVETFIEAGDQTFDALEVSTNNSESLTQNKNNEDSIPTGLKRNNSDGDSIIDAKRLRQSLNNSVTRGWFLMSLIIIIEFKFSLPIVQ